jgi:membrane protein
LPGAIVAVMTWIGLSYLLGSYFRHFDSLNQTYGPLGAAIALYVWFYLSGFAILAGGEINFLLLESRLRVATRHKGDSNRGITSAERATDADAAA